MNVIVAVDQNWAIGYKGDLLVRIKDDLKRFRQFTTGNVCIMGYNTLLSMPNSKPLPNRTTIVLYPDELEIEGATVVHSVHEALSEIKKYNTENVYVCGGGMIYSQFIDYCDTAYITKVKKAYDADTYFPNLDEKDNWEPTETVLGGTTEDGTEFEYVTYKNLNSK